jgi:hypothetical protein
MFLGGDTQLLDFQVNDQTYFLGLGDEEGEWEVFVASPNGPRRIPVYVDTAPYDDVKIVAKHRESVN